MSNPMQTEASMKRYIPLWRSDGCDMKEHSAGEWVRFEDHERELTASQARVKELEATEREFRIEMANKFNKPLLDLNDVACFIGFLFGEGQALRAQLTTANERADKAEAACAATPSAIHSAFETIAGRLQGEPFERREFIGIWLDVLEKEIRAKLVSVSTDAGKDYVKRSELEAAQERVKELSVLQHNYDLLSKRNDDLLRVEVSLRAEVKQLKADNERLRKAESRLNWLHDCANGTTDTEGFEWGIFRVKWVNGKAVEVWQTNADFSDLDEEMCREKAALYTPPTSQELDGIKTALADVVTVEQENRPKCGICGIQMDEDENCGGDCRYCMADAGDPDCIKTCIEQARGSRRTSTSANVPKIETEGNSHE